MPLLNMQPVLQMGCPMAGVTGTQGESHGEVGSLIMYTGRRKTRLSPLHGVGDSLACLVGDDGVCAYVYARPALVSKSAS